MSCTAPSTDDLARACRLLNASGAAYLIEPGTTWDAGSHIGDQNYDHVGWVDPTDTHAIVGGEDDIDACLVGASTDDGVVVAFRGTLDVGDPITTPELLDWLQDLLLPPGPVAGWPAGIAVHPGFYAAVDAVWDGLVSRLTDGSLDLSNGLSFTGHSKGGPMATIAAYRWHVEQSKLPQPSVVTFASPHPGNVHFADAFTGAGLTQTRYEDYLDIIPVLPPTMLSASLIEIVIDYMKPSDDLEKFAQKMACQLLDLAITWNYSSVGTGYYIDETHEVCEFDFGVSLEQTADLTLALQQKEWSAIAQAHCRGCAGSDCQGGYMAGVCPGQCS